MTLVVRLDDAHELHGRERPESRRERDVLTRELDRPAHLHDARQHGAAREVAFEVGVGLANDEAQIQAILLTLERVDLGKQRAPRSQLAGCDVSAWIASMTSLTVRTSLNACG